MPVPRKKVVTYEHPITDTCLSYVGDGLHYVDPIRYIGEFGDSASRALIPDEGV